MGRSAVPAGGGGADLFAAAEIRPVDLTLLWVFFAIRSVHLGQALIDVGAGYHSYAHPVVAAGVLTACVLDCAFIVARCLPRRRIDPTAVAVDVIVGVCGLIVIGIGLHGPDRTTSINWMLPYTVGTVLALAAAYRRQVATAATIILATSYLASVAADLRAGGAPLITAVVNAASYLGFYIVAALVVGLLRRLVRDFHRIQLEAAASSGRLARAQERNRQHRLLHDHALQALEAIAQGWSAGEDGTVAFARQEALRLRCLLDSDPSGSQGLPSGTPGGLKEALRELAVTFTGAGLHIQLVTPELTVEPSPQGVEALVGAAGEALNNVIKHAGVGTVVLRGASSETEVEVSVRDHGAGFELGSERRAFGLDQSVVGRMQDVGGRAEISSRPGRGTKITLRLPL